MSMKHVSFATLGFLWFGVTVSTASAETCSLKNLDAVASSGRDVKVTDEDTKQVVYNQHVAGGQIITITVSGSRGIYSYKYPGDQNYHPDTGFWCKNGQTTNF